MRQLLIFIIALMTLTTVYGQNCKPKPSCQPKPTTCNKSKVKYIYEDKNQEKEKKIKKFSFLIGPSVFLSPEPIGGLVSGKIATGSDSKNYFDTQNISGQIDGFMGIRFDKKRTHAIGIWGTTGLRSNENTARLMNRQAVSESIQDGINILGEIEAGIFWRERVRLSAGIGSQQFRDNANMPQNARYFTSSAGFLLPIGKKIFWHTHAKISYGRDFQKVSIRPSTGLMMNLNPDN